MVDAFMRRPYRTTRPAAHYAALVCHLPPRRTEPRRDG
jgi:hypothetical protein